MLRFLTSGESHGQSLIAILDGIPAGFPISLAEIDAELKKRQSGFGRGGRQRIENDRAHVLSGIRNGVTTGAPISIEIENKDWENWKEVMAVEPRPSSEQASIDKKKDSRHIKHFRPGHADLAGTLKYGHSEIRDVIERASARETASRVAAGALAYQLLRHFDIYIISHVLAIGNSRIPSIAHDLSIPLDKLEQLVDESDLRCTDATTAERMRELILSARKDGDSLGGVIEILADGVPPGLGSYCQWDRKIDGKLAQALMSIQAIKAVEIGEGISASASHGSSVHDPLYPDHGKLPFRRITNRAGGIEGGVTNGSRLMLHAFMKPIPTLRKGLDSLSYPEFTSHKADYERSDVCAVPAASVVCKAMVSLVLCGEFLEKFSGDCRQDIESAYEHYRTRISGNSSDK